MATNGIVHALLRLGACKRSITWAKELPPSASLQQAWDLCPHADWLMWLLGEVRADQKLIVLAACACARTALQYVPAGENRPRLAIDEAEKWVKGEVCKPWTAACAASAYTSSGYNSLDEPTVNAAIHAASAASSVAFSADAYSTAYVNNGNLHSVEAASAAVKACYYGELGSAKYEAQEVMARTVRGFFPHPPTVDFA
jgi:hypothetical protein